MCQREDVCEVIDLIHFQIFLTKWPNINFYFIFVVRVFMPIQHPHIYNYAYIYISLTILHTSMHEDSSFFVFFLLWKITCTSLYTKVTLEHTMNFGMYFFKVCIRTEILTYLMLYLLYYTYLSQCYIAFQCL